MRLIDADALIAKAYIMQAPNGFIHSVVTERQIVKAPTIEVPRWIPVTERLPEMRTIVLCHKDGQMRLGCYIGAEYCKRVAAFRHPKDQFAFGVTHWMPLPKPPEDGGAEE